MGDESGKQNAFPCSTPFKIYNAQPSPKTILVMILGLNGTERTSTYVMDVLNALCHLSSITYELKGKEITISGK